MESLYENFIGPFIFFSLIIALLMVFVVPLTKLSRYFKISQTYFIVTQLCGIICGVLGLTAIFILSPDIVKSYLWKIIIIPYAYLQIYMIYVMVARKTTAILDEKQEFNMGNAGSITLSVSIIVMGLVVMPLINNNLLSLNLLFPFYINMVILSFSLVTLYLYKHA